MKKIFIIFCFFIFISSVYSSNLYVSKKDIETGDYIYDCDFQLYDVNNNMIDSWIQNSSYHVSNVDNGLYKLVSRPFVSGVFNDSMSDSYILDIKNDNLKITIYDKVVSVPPNLHSNNRWILVGCLFIFIGVSIIYYCKYYFF